MMDREDRILWTGVVLATLFVVAVTFLAIFSTWEWSEDNVSGIVYNTKNNQAISGNTSFSVRAAVDKSKKVNVTTRKGFWLKMPWTCIDNVTVTEVK